ncbi:uncharacterized protein [Antedon mediterranea]|uniref:uncharacterized protein n=1 Tax=Antedon mediterranea TaxID=105859 RepID=UPI003AF59425
MFNIYHGVICFIILHCVLSAPTIVPKQNAKFDDKTQKIPAVKNQGLSNPQPLNGNTPSKIHQYSGTITFLPSPLPYSGYGYGEEATTEGFVISEDNTNDYIELNNNEPINLIHENGKTLGGKTANTLPNVNSEKTVKDYNDLDNLDYAEISNIAENYPSLFEEYLDYGTGGNLPPIGQAKYDEGKDSEDLGTQYLQGGGVDNSEKTDDTNVGQQQNDVEFSNQELSRPNQEALQPTFVREDFAGEDVEGAEADQIMAMVNAKEHPGLSNGIEYDVGVPDKMVNRPGVNQLEEEKKGNSQYSRNENEEEVVEDEGVPNDEEIEQLRSLVKKYGRNILDAA